MPHWEYCLLQVIKYREGTDSTPRELYSVTRPNSQPTPIASSFGLAGVLNDLGAEGWRLVDVEAGTHYFERPKPSHG